MRTKRLSALDNLFCESANTLMHIGYSGRIPLGAKGGSVKPPRKPSMMMRPSHPVLVVEDDTNMRDAVQSLLEMEGFSVVVAHDGDEALKKLHSGLAPCLILLDLAMPVKDGFEFRKEQLEDTRLAQIPAVAYSAVYDPEHVAARMQAAAFLRKPLEFETLLACIETHCLKDD